MKFVAQKVLRARLTVNGQPVSEIGHGLVVYFGVRKGDGVEEAEKCVSKLSGLRIFPDREGKMNLSIQDVKGEILFVSQFTLYGDCKRGNRPSFTEAGEPVRANALYRYAAEKLQSLGIPVKLGIFGAHMRIEQVNDGPVTVIYEV